MDARRATNCSIFAVAVVGMLGCSGAEGSGRDPLGGAAADGSDAVQSVAEELTPGTWGPLSLVSRNVKISRNPTLSAYEWDNAGGGNVCHGAANTYAVTPLDCQHVSIVFPYTFNDIRAIAIAQNTSHVYAWYSDGHVSEGTSGKLSQYTGGTGVRPFYNRSGLSMNSLIDADVSPNGEVYYYWLASSGTVYRSVGTSTDSGQQSGSVFIPNVPFLNPPTQETLVSISFNAFSSSNSDHNFIEAWYADGSVDESADSLSL